MGKFSCLGSSVLFTERDINMHQVKAWTAIDSSSIICKANLSDEIKRIFFQMWLCQFYYMDAPHGRWRNALQKKARWEMPKNATSKSWKLHPSKQKLYGPPTPYL